MDARGGNGARAKGLSGWQKGRIVRENVKFTLAGAWVFAYYSPSLVR